MLNDVTSGALRKKGFGVAARMSRLGLTKGLDYEDSDDDDAILQRIRSRLNQYGKREAEEDFLEGMEGADIYGISFMN